MAAIMIDGVPHRLRRGKLVPIPPKWRNRIPGSNTMRWRRKARVLKKAGRNPGGRRPHLRQIGPDPVEWD